MAPSRRLQREQGVVSRFATVRSSGVLGRDPDPVPVEDPDIRRADVLRDHDRRQDADTARTTTKEAAIVAAT